MEASNSKSSLTESFWGRVGSADQDMEGAAYEAQVEAVRQRILMALLRAGLSGNSTLVERIIKAPELLDLWYLRSDVMYTLAMQQGETEAGHRLAEISRFFVGLLPPGLANACIFSSRRRDTSQNKAPAKTRPAAESITLVAMRHASAMRMGLQPA